MVQITGTDIDPSSIILKTDSQVVNYDYDPINGYLTYLPSDFLGTGQHTLFVQAADSAGAISSRMWSFTVATEISGALHANLSLEVNGNAYVSGDTYSLGDTAISGNPTIAGTGYATGFISWDSINSPFLGMPQSNVAAREFPQADFDYYKSLAEVQGNLFSGNLHLTKKTQQSGVLFVDGDLKISGGTHNITAVVTGKVKVAGSANLAAHADSFLVISKDEVKISGHPTLEGVIYSEGEKVEIAGDPSLSGAVVSKGTLKVEGNMTVIDSLAPETPVLDQPNSPTNDPMINLTGLAEPNSMIEIIEDIQIIATGPVDASGSFNIEINLPEGSHQIMAVAIDSAGNISGPSANKDIVVDLTAPTVSFTNPGDGDVLIDVVTVEATAADNFEVAKVELFLDNQLLGVKTTAPYTFDWDTKPLDNQTYQLKAVAQDAAGNGYARKLL